MKCVVTGGAGFIGSHLVDRLIHDGHQVTVLDNFSTGRPENLVQHSGSPALSIHKADITDFEHIQPHFADIDWVFHLAGMADIVPSIQQPLNYHHANVELYCHLLEQLLDF